MTVRQPGSVAPTNNQGQDVESSPNSRKRQAPAAIAAADAAGDIQGSHRHGTNRL